jgi:plastocyanin
MPIRCLLAVLLCWSSAWTGEVTVTFTLDRQPPAAALAWVEGMDDWPAETVTIDQRDRTFLPELVACPPGGTVAIHNNDDQQHNVFALDQRLGVDRDLGLGQPGTVLELPVTWPAGEVVRAGCKIHPQMRLWVAAIPTRHHAVLFWPSGQRRATLGIPRIPDVAKSLRIWTAKSDPVSVAIGGAAELKRQGTAVGRVTVERRPGSP